MRIRKTQKIGKGTYISSSFNLKPGFISSIFGIIIALYYFIFKYCFFVPVKWIIGKLKKKKNLTS